MVRRECGRVYEADPAQGNERVCAEAERLIGNRSSNRKGFDGREARYLHFDYPENSAEVDVMVVPAGTNGWHATAPARHVTTGATVPAQSGFGWAYSHIDSAVERAPEIADSTFKRLLDRIGSAVGARVEAALWSAHTSAAPAAHGRS